MIYDRLRAEKDGMASTGNGRRQSYAHPPIPRMTNSYILNGPSKAEDILASTERGVYVRALGGGQTNPASGDFVFGVSEGYLIEGGKVTSPVRGANLTGRAIEVMSAVDAVADDFDTWEGVCGKDGQGVPVGSDRPPCAFPGSPWEARVADLAELAGAAVESALDNEAVEAYAEEARRTEVTAHKGEVEGLTFAE